MKAYGSIWHQFNALMVSVPQRKNVEKVGVLPADIVREGSIRLEASVVGVAVHNPRFWFSMKSNEVETTDKTVKIN
jgi:hypothetical protein